MQISVVSVLDNWFISDLNSLSQLLSAPNHQAYIDTPCHVDVHKPILLHTWQVPNNIKWLETTSLWIADQRFLEKLPLVSQSSRSASYSDSLYIIPRNGLTWGLNITAPSATNSDGKSFTWHIRDYKSTISCDLFGPILGEILSEIWLRTPHACDRRAK